jgi:hypothetical protein
VPTSYLPSGTGSNGQYSAIRVILHQEELNWVAPMPTIIAVRIHIKDKVSVESRGQVLERCFEMWVSKHMTLLLSIFYGTVGLRIAGSLLNPARSRRRSKAAVFHGSRSCLEGCQVGFVQDHIFLLRNRAAKSDECFPIFVPAYILTVPLNPNPSTSA